MSPRASAGKSISSSKSSRPRVILGGRELAAVLGGRELAAVAGRRLRRDAMEFHAARWSVATGRRLGGGCLVLLLRAAPAPQHDLTCAQTLLEAADPRALIGDKAYDADLLIEMLDKRAITPVIPPKENRKVKRDCDSRSIASVISPSVSGTKSSTTGRSPPAMTNSLEISLPLSTWSRLSSCSTEHRP
jgi:IS5 family transposase